MVISISQNQLSLRNRSRKVVAFTELTEAVASKRTAAKILGLPRTNLQRWRLSSCQQDLLGCFFTTPEGGQLLQRIVIAAHFVIQYRGKGIRSVGEFIELAGLSSWVASSHGALHSFSRRFEQELIAIGGVLRSQLAENMPRRKIVVSQDETFHRSRPCLVAMDVISNFILTEEYSEQRTKEDWDRVMDQSLKGLNVEIISATSDEGTAIVSHVKNTLGVAHSPDLFHIQQEIRKATFAPLRSQENSFEKLQEKAQKQLKKAEMHHGLDSNQAEERRQELRLREYGLAERRVRRKTVREEVKGMGSIYHPVDLTTGHLVKPEGVRAALKSCFVKIWDCVERAGLNDSCKQRIRKAQTMIEPMYQYLVFFFFQLRLFIGELSLESVEETFFENILFPLAYVEHAYKKLDKQGKGALRPILEELQNKARAGPVQGERLQWLESKAREAASHFQRSSSCVEGRNGVLSMMHHGFHGLAADRLQALTIIHNYYVKRADGTTAAGRFFGKEPASLFEEVLKKVELPGRPRAKWRIDRKGAKPRRLAA